MSTAVLRPLHMGIILSVVASTAHAQDSPNVWIDVNFGIAAAAEETYATSVSRTVFRETATFGAEYNSPRGAEFDFGGGYMFTPFLGAGVSFTGTAHTGPPTTSVRVPHPFFFNAFASDTAVGDADLDRVEGAVNIQAMVNVTPTSDRLRVRVFGGPTFFNIRADTVDDILFFQSFLVLLPANNVDITTYQFSEKEESGWGFHVGGDVSLFFNRVLGVGWMVRVSRGTVELPDFSGTSDVTVGGVQTGGGLRIRF